MKRLAVAVAVGLLLLVRPNESPSLADAALSPIYVRTVLNSLGWRADAAEWLIASVPMSLTSSQYGGAFYPGVPPVIGHIEINVASSGIDLPGRIEHEAHHAWDFMHPHPYLYDEGEARADLTLLSRQPEFAYAPAVAAARAVLADPTCDIAHQNHCLIERLNRDAQSIPIWYARKHFAYMACLTTIPDGPVLGKRLLIPLGERRNVWF